MLNQFSRTQLLLGREAMEKLAASRVAGFWQREKRYPGSTAFVPAAAGLMIAGEVVRDLTKVGSRKK